METDELSPIERRIVDAGTDIRTDAAEDITYQHTVLCQTVLPYKRPPEELRRYEREQGGTSLLLVAGEAQDPETGNWVELGLPWGELARLVIFHFNSEAIRTGSPVIDVEDSMTAFARRIRGRNPTGPELRQIKDQLARLAVATVRMAFTGTSRPFQVNTQIVTALDLWFPKDATQRVPWPSTLRLSDEYYRSLTEHAVPLDERAVAALAHSAMALDVYAWLAQRLHRVPEGKPQFIPWPALYSQFGQGYRRLRDFRAFFVNVLRQVKAVYPAARIEEVIGTRGEAQGLLLHHSPPPVNERTGRRRHLTVTTVDKPRG